VDILDKLYQKGVSRRNFLVGAGATGAVAALAGCNDATGGSTSPTLPTAINDVDILTFALNLEYLEAEFYLYAATGSGLAAADAGSGAGTTTVPATTKLTGLTTLQQNIVNEIAYDEQSHVQFLRKALTAAGVTPVPRPALDLTFFGPLAVAAGITTAATGTGSFSPFTSFDNFLIGAFIFEDVGVTAYNGAATLISAAGIKAGYLTAAAGIMAVEAYHAAYVRTVLTANATAAPGATSGTTTYAPFNAANKVSALRATLGGGNETPLLVPTGTTTLTTTVTPSAIVASNSNALAYARTPDQVHHIVYGSPTVGVAKGGFFPNGTNFRFAQTTT
jgi:hypothetical protein